MEAARHSGISPIEVHHYMSPQEAAQLVNESLGVAFVPKGVAEQLRGTDLAVRPLAADSLQITSHLVLRADQSAQPPGVSVRLRHA